MKYIYPAFFYEENNDNYSVVFPDFEQGTCGSTLEEAHYMAVDFLNCIICGMLEDDEQLPVPTDIKKITPSDDWEYKSVFSSLISVDIKAYAKYLDEQNKAIRKNITIPKWLSELADKQHINYSAVLQEALKRQLDV